MKIIAIGDTHGRKTWEQILSQEDNKFDRLVFIGDYFDTWDPFTSQEQVDNFNKIIQYKRSNPDTVSVLLGNHDTQYLLGEVYSGYQKEGAPLIKAALTQAVAENLVQLCHVEDDYMFTHAGVTKTWMAANGIDENNIEEEINMLFEHNEDAFKFNRADSSGSGDDIRQSPVWVRPQALISDFATNLCQVVGHTTQREIQYFDGKEPHKLILIDAVDIGEYLLIEDGVPRTAQLEKSIAI